MYVKTATNVKILYIITKEKLKNVFFLDIFSRMKPIHPVVFDVFSEYWYHSMKEYRHESF